MNTAYYVLLIVSYLLIFVGLQPSATGNYYYLILLLGIVTNSVFAFFNLTKMFKEKDNYNLIKILKGQAKFEHSKHFVSIFFIGYLFLTHYEHTAGRDIEHWKAFVLQFMYIFTFVFSFGVKKNMNNKL